ncbi:hypothetical protein HDV04_000686 [Boothiomyces sp. JEL0838]|nr:hypothetical protein HDV04_000670 [Boothiomyces sp. JEL0838]KAJ3314320.1 hypothetical protein HDV04_000686 [Boothiomyces sp. JEL0838]
MVFEILQRFNILTRPPLKKSSIFPLKLEIKKEIIYDTRALTEADLDQVSSHDFDPTLSNQQKSFYLYLRGRILNIFDSYHPFAEANLCKSVKLEPKFCEAWIELGECFWKKGDLDGAENCFKWVLDLEPSKKALISMAMIKRRQKSGNQLLTKDDEHLNESIQLCKKALALDIKYSPAWVGIGASYMAIYFKLTRNPSDLKKALAAFDQADINSSNDPDLYYSRAIIHQYLEEYEKSIKDYSLAASLDTDLAQTCYSAIEATKMFVSAFKKELEAKKSLNPTNLFYSTFKEKKSHLPLRLVILGQVERPQDPIKSSFIAMDTVGNVGGLTLCNVRNGLVQKSDMLEISNAAIVEKEHYKIVRVDDPRQIKLNGSKINDTDILWIEMRVESQH